MPTNPFDQFDATSSNPFDQFDHPSSGSSFKSGDFFGETGKLVDSAKGLIDQFKKEWKENKTLDELNAEAAKSPQAKAAIEAKLDHDTRNAHAAGSAALDLLGAAPAMFAGGVSGAASGLWNMDATKGLETGGKVMNNLLPSTLMGHEEDPKAGTYQSVMAPVTVGMDALNAVPQAAGEAVNAAGYPNAAGQVTDAGKLAIMAAMGVAGAREAYHSLTGKEPPSKAQLKIEDPSATKAAAPSNPFDQFDQSTSAHADDFAAVNPYDMGGHVSASDQGHPTTLDNPQGELFGGQSLEQPPASPVSADSLANTPVHPPLPVDDGAISNPAPAEPTAMANAMIDAQKDAAFRQRDQEAYNTKSADEQAAYAELDRQKQADFAKMEAQRELDHMNTVKDIESTPGRNFFTDPMNRDKLDLHDVTNNHGFAGDNLGDKSLMHPDATQSMVDALHAGDTAGALDVIAKNHDNVAYRNLAEYLKDKLDGLQIRMHDEGVLKIGDRHATGYYDPEGRTVGLSGVGSVSPHTVLHELVHAITSDFVNSRPNDLRVMGLKDLYNKLGDLGMKEAFPDITNVKELLAEAFSNPEFQDYLKQHQIQSRSVWNRFMDNVKSILGFSSSTRNHITDALAHVMDLGKQIAEAKDDNGRGQLKDAGMPGKLSDLMVTRKPERPNAVVNNENMKALKGIDKIKAQFDFTPLKPEQIIAMAKDATDIPRGNLETLKANLDAGGRMASLRHSNNPVIKYTFAHIDQAVKNYEKFIRENITNSQTGIKGMLRGLSKDEFTSVHQQMMLDEGVLERTSLQLRQMGWSDKMIALHQRIRQVDKEMLDRVNEARAQMNPPMEPIERRIGHLAGRFLGDFYHTVYERAEDGSRKRAVMMITDSTSRGAHALADYIRQEHPEWEVDDQKYNNIKQGQNSDRFSGFMELMSFIAKKDPEVARALDSLDKYNRRAATNYLNTLRHAKDKVTQPGGVKGSEGNKEYTGNFLGGVTKVDAMKNAEEGFKGHLAYLDTSAKWVEMQKAMANISKVVTDKDVTMNLPNAVRWSTAYTDHALHRNQGWMTDFAQSMLSEAGRVTGVGHTNITKAINWMSTAEMRNWMGIGNIPFALKHMLLPFQKMPAMMAYLKTVGDLDGSLAMSGMKSLSSYYHYLKGEHTTPFEKEAFDYAKENNVFNVNLDNLSGNIQAGPVKRTLGKLADLDFSAPEHAIRGNSFFFYAHLLKDSGMESQSALSAAEHLSKFLYTDYAPHEAPRAAAKAGWIGQLAFQVTRYKANELSQLGFFNRERMKGEDHAFMEKMTSNLPLMVHMGSLLAFTGATGMLAYNEMDHMYSLFRKYVMKDPDNLTSLLQRSKAPELVKYGIFSKLGIDAKISEKDLLPSPFPTTAAEINQMGLAFNALRHRDSWSAKQLAIGMAPSTLRGPIENHMFTSPQATTGPNVGKSLYLNPNTGEGRVWRSPEQQSLRNLGFHSIAETDETDNSYAMKRIEQDHKDLAMHVLDHAKSLMASGALTQEAAQHLAREYASHQQAGMPQFATELQSYAMKQHMSQRQQMELKAAQDRGMGNSLNIMQRNK